MLCSLKIKNFVIYDDVQLDFYDSFNVLTGETGAGKSLLIDALSLLLGERLQLTPLRENTTKAYIEATFIINDKVKEILETKYDLEVEDNILVISKDVYKDKGSVNKINSRTVSLSFLKEVTKYVIDIHSQFDNSYLLNPKNYLEIIDGFLTNDDLKIKEKYKEVYSNYKKIKEEISKINEFSLNDDEIEFIKYQIKEIEDLNLKENELENLELENKNLSNFSKILDVYSNLNTYFYGSSDILNNLYEVKKLIDGKDELFNNLFKVIENSYYEINDAFSELKENISSLEESQSRIEYIKDRIFKIKQVMRKHGNSLELMIAKLNSNKEKLELAENKEISLSKLNKKLKEVEKELNEVNDILNSKRNEVINLLTQKIKQELDDLYMSNAQFEIKLVTKDEFTLAGNVNIEFNVSMNKGMSLRPLNKVASGGEISRLMLALKVVFALNSSISTIIFDEVDSGVSGEVALAIGKKMRSLAASLQVITITHLPQVAALGEHHYHVSKEVFDDKTNTKVTLLTKNDHEIEIAKLISGNNVTPSSLKAAKELIKM